MIFRAFASGRGFHLLLDLIHDGLLHRAGDRVDTPGLEIAAGGGPKGGGQNVPKECLGNGCVLEGAAGFPCG